MAKTNAENCRNYRQKRKATQALKDFQANWQAADAPANYEDFLKFITATHAFALGNGMETLAVSCVEILNGHYNSRAAKTGSESNAALGDAVTRLIKENIDAGTGTDSGELGTGVEAGSE